MSMMSLSEEEGEIIESTAKNLTEQLNWKPGFHFFPFIRFSLAFPLIVEN
jgi:hypothetical protein